MPSLARDKQRAKTRKRLLEAEILLLLLLRRAANNGDIAFFTRALYRGEDELRKLGRSSVEDELATKIGQKTDDAARSTTRPTARRASPESTTRPTARRASPESTTRPTTRATARRDLSRAAKVAAGFLAFVKRRTSVAKESAEDAGQQAAAVLQQQAQAAIDNRLRQIAAFEAIRTFEEARRDTAEQIAVERGPITRRWDATLDSTTCTSCQGFDGQEVELDEEFAEGDPPLHPNCRCSIEYRFDT